MNRPVRARMSDGRLHFQHGPIDLILRAVGQPDAVEQAEEAAWTRFGLLLEELVSELPLLRAPLGDAPLPAGSVALRMVEAGAAFADVFLTPMAGVAGSVADEICSVIAAASGVRKAYVNNGGDVAFHLCEGESLSVGLVTSLEDGFPAAALRVGSASPIRGLATSGWSGRSFSFGIADAVTVVGERASIADFAATLVGNAVDLPGHPAIKRAPASSIDETSDLGERLVTLSVGHLIERDVARALDRGEAVAREFIAASKGVHGAVLTLRGQRRVVGIELDLPAHGWRRAG